MTKGATPVVIFTSEAFGWRDNLGLGHKCWFCASETEMTTLWPAMPAGCTKCACCGIEIYTGQDDPQNEAMEVCTQCYVDLELDNA